MRGMLKSGPTGRPIERPYAAIGSGDHRSGLRSMSYVVFQTSWLEQRWCSLDTICIIVANGGGDVPQNRDKP